MTREQDFFNHLLFQVNYSDQLILGKKSECTGKLTAGSCLKKV